MKLNVEFKETNQDFNMLFNDVKIIDVSDKYKVQIEELNQQILTLEEERTWLQTQLDNAIGNNEELVMRIEELDLQIEQLQSQIEAYENDFAEIKKVVNSSGDEFISDNTSTSDYAEVINERLTTEFNTGKILGRSEGYEEGKEDGLTDGYNIGYMKGTSDTTATYESEKTTLSLSLSETLTSGDNNTDSLEDNIEQAKLDIISVKTFIENHEKEVPVGTLSSTYSALLDSIIVEEKIASEDEGYQKCVKEVVNPANLKICNRARNGNGITSSIDDNLNILIADLDNIESTIENQKDVDIVVPDNNTATISEAIEELCEAKYQLGSNDGWNNGVVHTQKEFQLKETNLSVSLSEALTSGTNNNETLEVNVGQAKSDIIAIKNRLIEHQSEIPVGTLSSIYPDLIDEVCLNAKELGIVAGENNVYNDVVTPARDTLSWRTRAEINIDTLEHYVDEAIADFDAIEAAIEAQGVEVDDNNTSIMAGLINTACEEKYNLGRTDGYSTGYTEGEVVGIEEGKSMGYSEGYQKCVDEIVSPAKNSLSLRTTGDTGDENSLEYYIDNAIANFDAIETAIEAQGVDIVDNNTSDMADAITVACENQKTSGIEQGKSTERNTFWKNYIATMDSNYNSYYAFAGFGWNNNTFRPTRNMHIYNAASMFAMSRITDLAGILEEQGVTINFSSCGQFNSFAYGSKITHLPVISTVSASSLHGMCEECTGLHTFDRLILKNDGTQTATNIFNSCSTLKNIVIVGVIGSSFNMRWSPLTKDSIKGKEITAEEYSVLSATVRTNNVYIENGKYYYGGVVTALSSTATGKTLTLKKTAVDTAFETSEGATDGSSSEEWVALITNKSNEYDGKWTISLV